MKCCALEGHHAVTTQQCIFKLASNPSKSMSTGRDERPQSALQYSMCGSMEFFDNSRGARLHLISVERNIRLPPPCLGAKVAKLA
eukprot:4483268-Amphidinium_carterae.2